MYTFTTKPEGFRQVRRAILLRDLPFFLLTISCGMFIIIFRESETPINWPVLGGIYLLLILILTFVFQQLITRRRHNYESFLLNIDQDVITREEHYSDTLTVRKDEVNKIYKTSDGGLVIKGPDESDPLIIPPQMEESDKLERLLSEIKSFSPAPFSERYRFITLFAVLIVFAAFHLSTTIWLVGLSGLTLLGVVGYALYEYRHKSLAYIPKTRLFFAIYLSFKIVQKLYETIMGG
jgi:hypothetical protein